MCRHTSHFLAAQAPSLCSLLLPFMLLCQQTWQTSNISGAAPSHHVHAFEGRGDVLAGWKEKCVAANALWAQLAAHDNAAAFSHAMFVRTDGQCMLPVSFSRGPAAKPVQRTCDRWPPILGCPISRSPSLSLIANVQGSLLSFCLSVLKITACRRWLNSCPSSSGHLPSVSSPTPTIISRQAWGSK